MGYLLREMSISLVRYHFVGSWPRDSLIYIRLHRVWDLLLDKRCQGGIIHELVHGTRRCSSSEEYDKEEAPQPRTLWYRSLLHNTTRQHTYQPSRDPWIIQGFDHESRDNLTNPGIMSFSVLQMFMLDPVATALISQPVGYVSLLV